MDTTNSEETIEVKFFTKNEKYRVTPTPFRLPAQLARFGLSEVINHLLSLEPRVPFDFLIEGEFLRTSIVQYLQDKKLTFETSLEIEYVEAIESPDPGKEFIHDDWVACVDTTLADVYVTGSYDHIVRIWNTAGKQIMTCTGGHTKPIKDLVILQQKTEKATKDVQAVRFATASQDQTLKVWKANLQDNTSSVQFNCIGHKGTIETIDVCDITPTKFCSGSFDNTICIWDVTKAPEEPTQPQKKRKVGAKEETKNLTAVATLSGHKGGVSKVIWATPNELISGSYDHSLKTWDAANEVNISTLTGETVVNGMSYCPTSRLIATGHNDTTIRLWDFRTEEKLVWKSLSSHTGWVPSVCWHPSNIQLLVSGSYDKTVKFWDIRSKFPLYTLEGHTDKVLTVAWDTENRIVSGGADNKLKTWTTNDLQT